MFAVNPTYKVTFEFGEQVIELYVSKPNLESFFHTILFNGADNISIQQVNGRPIGVGGSQVVS